MECGGNESILSIHTEIYLILRFVSYRCTVVEFFQQLLARVALNLAKHIGLQGFFFIGLGGEMKSSSPNVFD